MLFKLLLFVALIYTPFSTYADCTDNQISPKIACAKEGDLLASDGDVEGAMSSWASSCKLGFRSSCTLLKKYKSNSTQVYKDYKTSPDFNKCVSGKLPNKKCFNIASQSIEHNPSPAINILHVLCKKDFAKACFKLGGYYYDSSELASAELLYQESCKKGLSIGCSMLSQVTSRMNQHNNQMIAARLSRIEKRQKLRNRLDYYYRLNKSDDLSDIITNSILFSELD